MSMLCLQVVSLKARCQKFNPAVMRLTVVFMLPAHRRIPQLPIHRITKLQEENASCKPHEFSYLLLSSSSSGCIAVWNCCWPG